MMRRILDRIKTGSVIISDGAWGTELQKMGLRPGDCPELWNIENPDKVYRIAKSYVEAGSDIISTNSFGGNIYRLREYKLEDKVHELNKSAVEISRRAAGKDVVVFASIGPSGKILMMDDIDPDDLIEAFGNQAEALKEGGADGILVETMTDLTEASIAVKAAIDRTGLGVACTFTFERSASGVWRTMMGQALPDCIREVKKAGAEIIGINCGNGIEGMIDAVREIRTIEPDMPIMVQPNAGMPKLVDGRIIYPETPEFMASKMKDLIAAGANIVGGCCGTIPEHIRRFVEKIR